MVQVIRSVGGGKPHSDVCVAIVLLSQARRKTCERVRPSSCWLPACRWHAVQATAVVAGAQVRAAMQQQQQHSRLEMDCRVDPPPCIVAASSLYILV